MAVVSMPVRDWSPAYFTLAAVGTVLPYSRFLPWVADHGLDPAAFVTELFSTRIGGFFGWDVIVSAIVTIIFIRTQAMRDRVSHAWLAIAGTLLVGVSCGLPLFLGLREQSLRAGR